MILEGFYVLAFSSFLADWYNSLALTKILLHTELSVDMFPVKSFLILSISKGDSAHLVSKHFVFWETPHKYSKPEVSRSNKCCGLGNMVHIYVLRSNRGVPPVHYDCLFKSSLVLSSSGPLSCSFSLILMNFCFI